MDNQSTLYTLLFRVLEKPKVVHNLELLTANKFMCVMKAGELRSGVDPNLGIVVL